MKWAAIVVAAGRGSRFGVPKQFIELGGIPMVGWSIRIFAAMPEISELVVATEPESIAAMQELCRRIAPNRPSQVVRGGATRRQSTYEALRVVSDACDAVLVHDGARPLVTVEDVRAGMAEVRDGFASLLATPVIDTVKEVEPGSTRVIATLDRRRLWAAQTPQFARTVELRAAHEKARSEAFEATDDAALLERNGVAIVVVRSKSENFKVTHPEDAARAEAVLYERERVAT